MLATASLVVATLATPAITDKNWKSHPTIVEIRQIFAAIEEKKAEKGAYKIDATQWGCEGPYSGGERTIYRDPQAKIRLLVDATGSEDSAVTTHHYYDTQGRLRFVLATAGAVNETSAEYRVYFDEAGKKRVWEDYRLVKGPGYPFPRPFPSDMIVLDAAKAVVAKPKCGKAAKG